MDRPRCTTGRVKKHCGCLVERVCDRALPAPERYRPARLARIRRGVEVVSDSYVKKLLNRRRLDGCLAVEFPQCLIDLKREVVRIERFIRKAKECTV